MVILLKLIVYIFAIIPHNLVMSIAHIANIFFYRIMKKGKWGLKTNRILPKVFKDREKKWYERILKENALHLMKFAGEMLKARFIRDWGLNKKCYIRDGRDYFEDLCHSKEGFVILTCHLGNWEYGAAYIALNYRRIYAPVFVESSKGNELINWVREGHNVVLLEASRNPRTSARTLMKMLKLLNDGEIIYLVADQYALTENIKGNLFGKELSIFGGPFILGKKTKKAFLPMYTLRDEKNRIAIYFEEPFFLNGNDLRRDIKKVTDFFERNISKHPEQYLWSQDRW